MIPFSLGLGPFGFEFGFDYGWETSYVAVTAPLFQLTIDRAGAQAFVGKMPECVCWDSEAFPE